MNNNQNHKTTQMTSETLIVGVNIAKHNHFARAQDFRGLELGKTCFFENTKAGFHSFLDWINQLVKELTIFSSLLLKVVRTLQENF